MPARIALYIVLVLLIWLGACPASPPPAVPDHLRPWTEWVLHDFAEQRSCTPALDDSGSLHCDWPSELAVSVTSEGGTFVQQWLVQHERWLQLPGDADHWPQDVRVDDQPALVIGRNGTPHLRLGQGQHRISGSFAWRTIPEFITLPAHTGIVRAQVNSIPLEFPNVDDAGRLWLRAQLPQEVKAENRLRLQAHRLLDDLIPFRESIHLQLDVSGNAREIVLGPVLANDRVVPVALESQLPARLEPDGRLRIQVRPGQWTLSLICRHSGLINELTFIRPDDGVWPEEEIWSFNAQPRLRIVEIEGAATIDPLQTTLPAQWRNYPAYRLTAGQSMRFMESKRGDPVPAPDQLALQRNIWLHFDGSGYTIQDLITGSKNTDWRLEMNPPTVLGRVAVDGAEQFITRREGSARSGIELRKGLLNLTADSLYRGEITRLPATGWDHDFQQVSARVFLPPGWRLIDAGGADAVSNTWLKRWTLLDLFLVLIFTLAVARLYSKPLAGLALAALVLSYHEPQAPRWIWLAILAGVALLRHLPQGKSRSAVRLVHLVNILFLLAIVIPFSISQLREGIYPQLEKPWQSMLTPPAPQQKTVDMAPAPPASPAEEAISLESPAAEPITGQSDESLLSLLEAEKRGPGSYASARSKASTARQVAQYDPSMINQTGPGLPAWQWNTFTLSWSGPVQRGQSMRLQFTGPKVNLGLAILRVALVALLLLGLLAIRYRRGKGLTLPGWQAGTLALLILAQLTLSLPVCAGEIPSPELLEELRTRLLEPDDCFPECADIGAMAITITPDRLMVTLEAQAQIPVALPLPGNARHWFPGEVRIDGQPARGLLRKNDAFWLLVPAGRHEVTLVGRIPRQNTLQLELPLRPHRVSVEAEGWTVEGIRDDGVVDRQLQFRRMVADEIGQPDQILETGILPPFLLIERTLRLGLDWRIETSVRRLSPTGAAVVFSYPLLPGEALLTEGIKVDAGQAQLSLDARQETLQWESVLARTGEISLRHPDTTLWTETWRVDVSPIFHLEASGIPVILHQEGNRWHPTWHPWPGEEVHLVISRPAGVEGQTATIDKSVLESRPGERATDVTLHLTIRSSQGGQHTLTLPEAAQLQQVRINSQVQPIRQEERRLVLPLKPGTQEIELQWREPLGICAWQRTPTVDLGIDSVNTHLDLRLPQNRWPLLVGGPRMGPAVLFWSTVLILLLVSVALARSGHTPLRFHQWFLLGIGMSQSSIAAGLLIAGWIIVLGLRGRLRPDLDKTLYNLVQVGIALLTLLALASLITAISMGLLGHPDMNIVGNGSSGELLRWYQDRSEGLLPRAWVLSIPMLFYRLAMLAWALWISFTLLNLLRLGWRNFSQPVLWHRIPRKVKAGMDAPDAAPGHEHDAQG